MKGRSVLNNAVLPLAVMVGAVLAIRGFMATRPEPPPSPPAKGGQVVQVVAAEAATRGAGVRAVGRVRPARELSLTPEVAGRVEGLHAGLVAGGLLKEGDVALTIDPKAFRLAVAQQEANVAASRVDLQLESGRRVVAEKEWSLLEGELKPTEEGRELALRKPQEKLAQVRVGAAQAALARARLDLERLELTVPFNALVREETVEVGSFVGPQAPVARVVGTDHFWVEAAVPLESLARIGAPAPGQESGGGSVTVRLAGATGDGASWKGRVLRVLGDLDPVGAQARVLVEIPDPLGLASGAAPLLLNAFVEVTFEGAAAGEAGAMAAVRVPRKALREGDKIWVLAADDTLQIRDVEVVLREPDSVLVGAGLEAGERVITSRLAAPLPGMKLRLPGAPSGKEAAAGESPAAPGEGKPPDSQEGTAARPGADGGGAR
jgi:RND family efflux transporter MFP subunit